MIVFFWDISISTDLVHHVWSSNMLCQFHAKVSKIDWDLDVEDTNWTCIGSDAAATTTCWRIVVFEIHIPKLLPYSWITEGRWGFESTLFRFFCFSFSVLLFLFVIFSYIHLDRPQSAPLGSLLQLGSPFCSTILICFSFSVWRWLSSAALKLDPRGLRCWWCPEDLPLYLS